MKYCNLCNEKKPDTEFYASNRTRCKPCVIKTARESRNKDPIKAREWRKQDKRKKRRAQGCLTRKVVAERAALRRIGNRAASIKAQADRMASPTYGMSKAEYYRYRYNNDPVFNLKERMRRQLSKAMKRDGVGELMRGAIRRGTQSRRVEELLGYTVDDLKSHIERQFVKGMNWDRFKRGEIHIDHIIPQKAFDLSDDNEWRSCWSLSNLQPLWAKDNLSKSARVERLI